MNCKGFKSRYEAYMGDELTEALAAKVEEHLAACPPCREWYETQQAIGEALRAAADLALPPPQYFDGLFQRIAPRLERAGARERFWNWALEPLRCFLLSGAPPLRLTRAALLCSAGLACGALLAPGLWPGRPEPAARGGSELASAGLSRETAPVAPARGNNADDPNPVVNANVAPPKPPKESVWVPNNLEEPGVVAAVAPVHVRTVSASAQPAGEAFRAWAPPSIDVAGPAVMEPVTLPTPRAGAGGVNIARKLKEYSVFEELQALKAGLYQRGESGLLRGVQRVEKALGNLSEFQDAEEADYQKQMQIYQEAQSAYIAKDAATALKKYAEAIAVNDKTRWACIARFDLGNLYYEATGEFDKALECYTACKDGYKREDLNEAQRRSLEERLEFLSLYKPFGYKPLQLFQTGAAAAPEKAVAPYLQLIREFPQTPLARKAVLELARLCVDEKCVAVVPWQVIYADLSENLRREPTGPLAAHLYFATAEIQNYRFQEPREAMLQYSKARQLSSDPELRGRAAEQLKNLRYRGNGSQGN